MWCLWSFCIKCRSRKAGVVSICSQYPISLSFCTLLSMKAILCTADSYCVFTQGKLILNLIALILCLCLIGVFNFHYENGLSVYFISMQILLHFYELICLNNLVESAFLMKCIATGKRNNWKVKLSLLCSSKKQGDIVGVGTGLRTRLCLRKLCRASSLYATFCHSRIASSPSGWSFRPVFLACLSITVPMQSVL